MRRMPRSGFTLIEGIVVVAITAVGASLAISAVQRARDAAARIQCANNLRQVGLALHSYHTSMEIFPSGVDVEDGTSRTLYASWHEKLLPHIGQDALWQQTQSAFEQNASFAVNPPHLGLSSVIRVYACPLDERTLYPQLTPFKFEVALTSYLGIAGLDFSTRDGVLFTDSAVRLSDITDGASNTMIVGERPPSADLRFGWWYAGVGENGSGSCDMVMGVRERPGSLSFWALCSRTPSGFRSGSIGNQCDMFHFWSIHVGGAHFLFADGSVHFMSYSAAPLMSALASRAGGEAVAAP
jgi:prepilin-type N-terminal cleavage/methylation domain-containing protein/prepilin-type processing-associated H-X9-DG protein